MPAASHPPTGVRRLLGGFDSHPPPLLVHSRSPSPPLVGVRARPTIVATFPTPVNQQSDN